MPSTWIHRISLFTKNGEYYSLKRKKEYGEGERIQEIAGPLCFSGGIGNSTNLIFLDLVAQNLEISPLINVDDFIIIHDAGAYTFGMWSRYNSRQAPAIYGFKRKNDEIEFILFKKAEEVEEVLKFWK
jgi:diaminopimelate decarboxylase